MPHKNYLKSGRKKKKQTSFNEVLLLWQDFIFSYNPLNKESGKLLIPELI